MSPTRISGLDHLALISVLRLLCFLATLLFVPALTYRYPEAWIVWAMLALTFLAFTLHFLRHGRSAVAHRLGGGARARLSPTQRLIQSITTAGICLTFVLAGMEYRRFGNAYSFGAGLGAYAALALGLWFLFVAVRENHEGAASTAVEPGRPVIDTGPYARIRHPIYAAAMIALLALPVALGSRNAYKGALLACAALVVRIRDEERFLLAAVPGYRAYCARVRFRLLPNVW